MKSKKLDLINFRTVVSTVILLGSGTAGAITSLNEIDYWVGTGANEAALIVDFNDGKSTEAWAWGYRWDGSANGGDMILAIAAIDPKMSIVNGGAPSSVFVTEISYDGSVGLQSGISDFFSGADLSWGYYNVSSTSDAVANNWTVPNFGASDRILSDGSWDAWSFGEYDPITFDHTAPPDTGAAAAAPVPEPAVFPLVFSVVAGLTAVRRRVRPKGSSS